MFHIFANATPESLELITADTLLQASNDLPVGDFGTTLARIFLTLFAILLLLGGSIWVLRKLIQQKLQRGTGHQLIQVIEKKMISPKTMLYVIEIDNKKIVLAESQLEVRKIETISVDEPEVTQEV